MKNKRIRFSLMIAVLALTAQLAFVTPSAQAQNSNSSEMMEQTNPGRGGRCQRRCRVAYNRCLRNSYGNPGRRRACARRYRWCVRNCRY